MFGGRTGVQLSCPAVLFVVRGEADGTNGGLQRGMGWKYLSDVRVIFPAPFAFCNRVWFCFDCSIAAMKCLHCYLV